ncbi:MAG: sporulation protein YqfC [Firmicutes bacterium]|nr:sporulation protein YqfC [Bacillota bacterium]MCL5039413.1 sporulation protein YqfC [Bacillota bacterium]
MLAKHLASLFDLPGDVVLNLPRLTMVGNLQVIIENHRGVVEYSPRKVIIAYNQGRVILEGEELVIGTIQSEEIAVTGRVNSLLFCQKGE